MASERIPDVTKVPPTEELAVTCFDAVTEEEAQRQGAWAYTFGFSMEHNPYSPDEQAWDWWDEGYWTAADSDEAPPSHAGGCGEEKK